MNSRTIGNKGGYWVGKMESYEIGGFQERQKMSNDRNEEEVSNLQNLFDSSTANSDVEEDLEDLQPYLLEMDHIDGSSLSNIMVEEDVHTTPAVFSDIRDHFYYLQNAFSHQNTESQPAGSSSLNSSDLDSLFPPSEILMAGLNRSGDVFPHGKEDQPHSKVVMPEQRSPPDFSTNSGNIEISIPSTSVVAERNETILTNTSTASSGTEGERIAHNNETHDEDNEDDGQPMEICNEDRLNQGITSGARDDDSQYERVMSEEEISNAQLGTDDAEDLESAESYLTETDYVGIPNFSNIMIEVDSISPEDVNATRTVFPDIRDNYYNPRNIYYHENIEYQPAQSLESSDDLETVFQPIDETGRRFQHCDDERLMFLKFEMPEQSSLPDFSASLSNFENAVASASTVAGRYENMLGNTSAGSSRNDGVSIPQDNETHDEDRDMSEDEISNQADDEADEDDEAVSNDERGSMEQPGEVSDDIGMENDEDSPSTQNEAPATQQLATIKEEIVDMDESSMSEEERNHERTEESDEGEEEERMDVEISGSMRRQPRVRQPRVRQPRVRQPARVLFRRNGISGTYHRPVHPNQIGNST
ncbi:unnamed protein product [Orchesella dallaii]|uniref:Uncharacterized protein n=1 Tax=Orchesella dallaii TaxID=48710 RepID=A0ABP1QNQ8_9HEXA